MPVLSGPLTQGEIKKSRNGCRGNLPDLFIIGPGDFLRFSSVTSILTNLNIPSLEHRRQLSIIILLLIQSHPQSHALTYLLQTCFLLPLPTEDTIRDFTIYLPGPAITATPSYLDLSNYETHIHPA